jgi:methanogenic corrinoid protein MtbC1
MMNTISAMVKPRLAGSAAARKAGKVPIGTGRGDHDIGKNIVTFMLDATDSGQGPGIDVPKETFVAEIKA